VRAAANDVKQEIVKKASSQDGQAIEQDIRRQCERTKDQAQDPNFPTHPSGVDAAEQVLNTMDSETNPVYIIVQYGNTYWNFVEALKKALDHLKKVKNQEQRLMMTRDRFDMDESAIDSIKQDTETSMNDIEELIDLLKKVDNLDTKLNQEAKDSAAHQALRSVEGNLEEITKRLSTLEERISAIETQEDNIEKVSADCEEELNELEQLFKELNEEVFQKSDMFTQKDESNISRYIGNLESILEEVKEEYEYDENRLDHEEKTSRELDQELQELDEKFQ
jgi:chromosome segregation ATPase